MKCLDIQHKLVSHLEGVLNPEEKGAVEKHLHDCEACRSEYHLLNQAFKQIECEKKIKPPDFLQDRIVQSMFHTGAKPGKEKWLLPLQRVAAVLLLFMGLVGGIALGTALYGNGETFSGSMIEEFYLGSDVGEFESFLLNK